MIITLIGIAILVLGIIGMIIFLNNNTFIELISLILISLGAITTIVCVIYIILANFSVEKDIYDHHMKRESIIKQIECISSDYEDVSKATIIQNVYDWNKEVYNAKYWSNNLWTNWFWNKNFVDSLEYIEMED